MDKLEFDNFELNNSGQHTHDQDSVDDARSSEEQAIKFSSSVVIALEQKAKEHNNNSETKVNLSQLKKVYRRGAESRLGEQNRGLSAMARVNMFLRMKRDGKIVYQEPAVMEETLQIKELVFENRAKIQVNSFVDVTDSLIPIDDDFIQASEDIKAFELNYDFQDINELYLDDYEKLDIIWG